MSSKFQSDIEAFNHMYKLPVASKPTWKVGVPSNERLRAFKKILSKELDEIDEIIEILESDDPKKSPLETMTMLADLLGDLQVYCASEMCKFGLPLNDILEIIMDSNMSKLGADGLPIYDADGKVQKGPNYWKPEPQIEELLSELTSGDKAKMNAEARDILNRQNAMLAESAKIMEGIIVGDGLLS